MSEIYSCGMTREEIDAEAAEAERETAEYEAQHEALSAGSGGKPSKDKTYYRNNRARRRHESAMYRARKLGAVPDDLTDAQEQQILEVHKAAEKLSRATGIEHEVDHMVPLVGVNKDGDTVIHGKHVAENLRAIPKSLNRKRGNWFFVADLERKRPSRARAKRERQEQARRDDGDDDIPF
ncbi:MAG: hypothetical protein U1E48_05945 [Paracoccaceae bacterium]